MIVSIVVFAIAIFIIGIMHIPVSVFVEYQNDIVIYLKALFIRYDIFYDKKPKQSMSVREYNRIERKRKKQQAKEKAKATEKTEKKEKTQKKESSLDKAKKLLSFIREFSSLILNVLKEFLSELYVEIKALNVNVSCEDVSDTALLYTGISQAMNMLFAIVEENKLGKIEYNNVSCECDYLSKKFSADVKISVTIRIGGAVRLAAYAMYKFIRLKINERVKYGQQNQ